MRFATYVARTNIAVSDAKKKYIHGIYKPRGENIFSLKIERRRQRNDLTEIRFCEFFVQDDISHVSEENNFISQCPLLR